MLRSLALCVVLAVGTVLFTGGHSLIAAEAEQSPAKKVAAQQTIEEALVAKVSLDLVDTPLVEVARFLGQTTDVPVRLDKTHLADIGMGAESVVSLAAKNISLRSALNLLCESLGQDVAWTVRNEAVTFTSRTDADSNLGLKVYNVRDLVVFDDDPNGLADYDTLIEAITGTIAPTNWDQVGGPGSIVRCDLNGIHALVISQTPEIHGQIDSLLAQLRKLKAKPSP